MACPERAVELRSNAARQAEMLADSCQPMSPGCLLRDDFFLLLGSSCFACATPRVSHTVSDEAHAPKAAVTSSWQASEWVSPAPSLLWLMIAPCKHPTLLRYWHHVEAEAVLGGSPCQARPLWTSSAPPSHPSPRSAAPSAAAGPRPGPCLQPVSPSIHTDMKVAAWPQCCSPGLPLQLGHTKEWLRE